MEETKVLIIGAGPAGITAAIYLKRAGINVKLIEKSIPGGQIVNTDKIENYPGFTEIRGYELATDLYNQTKKLKINYSTEEAIKIQKKNNYYLVTTNKNVIKTKYIIIASGREKKKISGENVSYCAVCDGTFYKNKNVAVIGGGNSAYTEALYLSNICSKVYIVMRSNPKADKILQEKTKNRNIIIKPNSKGLKIKNRIIETQNETIEVDGIFASIGSTPNLNYIKDLEIETDNNYIKINNNQETSETNIYAVGDTIKKQFYQITTATSEGTIAALSIIKKES